MKRAINYIKYLGFMAIFFLPQLAFAADGGIGSSNPLSLKLFTPPSTDFSLSFLRHIFGMNFLGHIAGISGGTSELVSSGQSMLGVLFGVFNAGVISIAAMFLIYTTVRSIVDTAQEGEVMGKKLSHWTAIRTALGIGILVPKFSGFSFIQVFVMWTIIQGVGLADHAWSMGLDYLQKGGVIYQTSSVVQQTDKIDPLIVATDTNQSKVKTAPPAKSGNAGASDMLHSLVCMHTLDKLADAKRQSILQDIKNNPQNYPKPGTPEYSKLVNDLSTSYLFHAHYNDAVNVNVEQIPGYRKNEVVPAYVQNLFKGSKTEQGTGICGAYDEDVAGSQSQLTNRIEYGNAKKAGMTQMIAALDPDAKRIVDRIFASKSKVPPKITNSDAEQLVSAGLSYQTIIYPERLYAGRQYQKRNDDFYDKAKTAGWSMAGSYYHDIATINSVGALDKQDYLLSVIDGKFGAYPPSIDASGTERKMRYGKMLTFFQKQGAGLGFDANKFTLAMNWSDSSRNAAIDLVAQLNAAVQKQDSNVIPNLRDSDLFNPGGSEHLGESLFEFAGGGNFGIKSAAIVEGFATFGAALPLNPEAIGLSLEAEVNNAVHSWFGVMVDQKSDNLSPIAKLSSFGSDLILFATTFWEQVTMTMIANGTSLLGIDAGLASAATAIGATGSMFGIGTAAAMAFNTWSTVVYAGLKVLSSIMMSILPLGLAITAPLFVMGITLSVYVPLIPFILFVFGVISWLIFVIEAMAAAPLVALGITHPEGHDLMGKSEQAVMLLLSVFLRPICMIIGLIAAIVLSYVALEVLNAGFAHVIKSVGLQGGTFSFLSPVGLVQHLMILVVYTYIVVALINQCFGLIHVIPEKIMTWIGLHPQSSGDEQRLESVKAGVGQFAEAGAKGAGESATSHKDLMGVGKGPQAPVAAFDVEGAATKVVGAVVAA